MPVEARDAEDCVFASTTLYSMTVQGNLAFACWLMLTLAVGQMRRREDAWEHTCLLWCKQMTCNIIDLNADRTMGLQDENEEMGRELSEGRVHNLERQLALAKGYAEDMRAAFQECEDHATALDEEADKIQEEV